MRKIILGLLIISSVLNAGTSTFLCTTDKFEVKDKNGKTIRSGTNSTKSKIILTTEWYGKPSGVSVYRIIKGKDNLDIVIPNTQTKTEWIQEDKLFFETSKAKLIMTKGTSTYVEFINKIKNGTV